MPSIRQVSESGISWGAFPAGWVRAVGGYEGLNPANQGSTIAEAIQVIRAKLSEQGGLYSGGFRAGIFR